MSRKLALAAATTSAMLIWAVSSGSSFIESALASGTSATKEHDSKIAVKPDEKQKSNAEELLGLEKRRQQLMEKESALTAKEQELNKLSSSLDARLKQLNAAQKALEDTLNEKKKREAELANAKYQKMQKLIKAMKPDEAAKILDKLDEPIAIGLMERYDQKTVLKLAKYISQPRLLKWIRENLESGLPK